MHRVSEFGQTVRSPPRPIDYIERSKRLAELSHKVDGALQTKRAQAKEMQGYITLSKDLLASFDSLQTTLASASTGVPPPPGTILVKADGGSFLIDRCIAENRIPYFRAWVHFEQSAGRERSAEMCLQDVPADAVGAILRWAYSGVLQLSVESVLVTLKAALYFDAQTAVEQALTFISEHVSTGAASSAASISVCIWDAWDAADHAGHAELALQCRVLALSAFAEVLPQLESRERLEQLLSDPALRAAASERQVLESLLSWWRAAAAPPTERPLHELHELLELICFPCMSVVELRELEAEPLLPPALLAEALGWHHDPEMSCVPDHRLLRHPAHEVPGFVVEEAGVVACRGIFLPIDCPALSTAIGANTCGGLPPSFYESPSPSTLARAPGNHGGTHGRGTTPQPPTPPHRLARVVMARANSRVPAANSQRREPDRRSDIAGNGAGGGSTDGPDGASPPPDAASATPAPLAATVPPGPKSDGVPQYSNGAVRLLRLHGRSSTSGTEPTTRWCLSDAAYETSSPADGGDFYVVASSSNKPPVGEDVPWVLVTGGMPPPPRIREATKAEVVREVARRKAKALKTSAPANSPRCGRGKGGDTG